MKKRRREGGGISNIPAHWKRQRGGTVVPYCPDCSSPLRRTSLQLVCGECNRRFSTLVPFSIAFPRKPLDLAAVKVLRVEFSWDGREDSAMLTIEYVARGSDDESFDNRESTTLFGRDAIVAYEAIQQGGTYL